MELAGLKQRAYGAIIDGLLGAVPYFLVAHTGAAALQIAGVALFVILVAVQCRLLAKDGQTIGKRAAKTRIVLVKTDQNGGIVPNVLLRGLVASLPNVIPLYWVVDTLFIFRADRRCVHDFIAGTKVVNIPA